MNDLISILSNKTKYEEQAKKLKLEVKDLENTKKSLTKENETLEKNVASLIKTKKPKEDESIAKHKEITNLSKKLEGLKLDSSIYQEILDKVNSAKYEIEVLEIKGKLLKKEIKANQEENEKVLSILEKSNNKLKGIKKEIIKLNQ